MINFSSRIYRSVFPSVMFSARDDKVYLTFDDGPHPVATPRVLEILGKFNLRATFFLLGSNVKKHRELAKMIDNKGHAVGNHSYDHPNLLLHSAGRIQREIVATNDIIAETIGAKPTLFRPPYGYFDFRTLGLTRSLGMEIVHWSNDLKDFRKRTSEHAIAKAVRQVGAGSIVLMHDNDSTANKIDTLLPIIIGDLMTRGYKFDSLA